MTQAATKQSPSLTTFRERQAKRRSVRRGFTQGNVTYLNGWPMEYSKMVEGCRHVELRTQVIRHLASRVDGGWSDQQIADLARSVALPALDIDNPLPVEQVYRLTQDIIRWFIRELRAGRIRRPGWGHRISPMKEMGLIHDDMSALEKQQAAAHYAVEVRDSIRKETKERILTTLSSHPDQEWTKLGLSKLSGLSRNTISRHWDWVQEQFRGAQLRSPMNVVEHQTEEPRWISEEEGNRDGAPQAQQTVSDDFSPSDQREEGAEIIETAALPEMIFFSTFAGARNKRPSEQRAGWGQFGEFLILHSREEGDRDKLDQNAICCSTFQGEVRRSDAATPGVLAVIDVDGAQKPIEAARDALERAGIAAYLHHTKSHSAKDIRYRVYLCTSAALSTKAERRKLAQRIGQVIQEEPDLKAVDAARLHFLPHGGVEIHEAQGGAVDVGPAEDEPFNFDLLYLPMRPQQILERLQVQRRDFQEWLANRPKRKITQKQYEAYMNKLEWDEIRRERERIWLEEAVA